MSNTWYLIIVGTFFVGYVFTSYMAYRSETWEYRKAKKEMKENEKKQHKKSKKMDERKYNEQIDRASREAKSYVTKRDRAGSVPCLKTLLEEAYLNGYMDRWEEEQNDNINNLNKQDNG